MGQRRDYATKWAAQIELRLEECALGMVQRSNYAAAKDVQNKLNVEECVGGTGQSSNYAAEMDVQITPRSPKVVKDAKAKPDKEECVST